MSIKFTQLTPLVTVDDTVIVPVVDVSGVATSKKTTVGSFKTHILAGNAATANKLYSAVDINGVAFDGSTNITITAEASTLSGTSLPAAVVSSSLTSVGTLGNLTVTNPISGSVTGASGNSPANALTGNTLASGVLTSSLTSVGTLGNLTVTNTITGSINGNAATVTNGVYTTDTGTVTNTMLAGSIANNKLSNNSVTFNGVTVALGASGSITTDIPIASNVMLGGILIGPGFNISVNGTLQYGKRFHGFSVDANSNLIYSYTSDSTIELQDEFGADIYEDTDIGTTDYSYSMDVDGNLIVTYEL